MSWHGWTTPTSSPRHVKDLLEVHWEAARGTVYQKGADLAPTLALYVLGGRAHLLFDVPGPKGVSKHYTLDEDCTPEHIREAVAAQQPLALPREIERELQRLALAKPNALVVRCWWEDPELGPPGRDAGGASVRNAGYAGGFPHAAPFRLPDGVRAEEPGEPVRTTSGRQRKQP